MAVDQSKTPVWKAYLYRLQQNAPAAVAVECPQSFFDVPHYYGSAFHGRIGREEARERLGKKDGAYLVRESPSAVGQYTLTLSYNKSIKHYKIYWDGRHYVGEKYFDTLSDLVSDGLISLYLEDQAGDYIREMYTECEYAKSPYMTLNRFKRRVLRDSLRRKSSILNGSSVKTDPQPQQPEKTHSFNTHNFKGLNWCDLCGNFIWGIVAQGVKCDDCAFIAHRKCSEYVPNDCCPDLKGMRGIFGMDLTTLSKAHNMAIPYVVEKCVKEIECRGLTTEGVYRVCASADDVDSLKLSFDTEEEMLSLSGYSIAVIAGVLKLYLRVLPIPLITEEAQPYLLDAVRNPDTEEEVRLLGEALEALPSSHLAVLKFLMKHLYKVSTFDKENLMTIHNVSTVFCPTLMRSQDAAIISLERSVIEALILYHDRVFH